MAVHRIHPCGLSERRALVIIGMSAGSPEAIEWTTSSSRTFS